jgi:hypothetical protein
MRSNITTMITCPHANNLEQRTDNEMTMRRMRIFCACLIVCVSLEVRNMYGGTVPGCATDGAMNRPTADHATITKSLLDAGALIEGADYRTGNEKVDEVLRRHGDRI